jgi:hypothetical protein
MLLMLSRLSSITGTYCGRSRPSRQIEISVKWIDVYLTIIVLLIFSKFLLVLLSGLSKIAEYQHFLLTVADSQ